MHGRRHDCLQFASCNIVLCHISDCCTLGSIAEVSCSADGSDYRYSSHVFAAEPGCSERDSRKLTDSQQCSELAAATQTRRQRIKQMAGTTLTLGMAHFAHTEAEHEHLSDYSDRGTRLPEFGLAPADEDDEVT